MGKAGKRNKKRKKETQQLVFEKLFGVMEEYKNDLKEKKLISRLQKVSKFFATSIIKADNKNRKYKKRKEKAQEMEQQSSVELQAAAV